jgi:LCP family protein required for cell wall assembly
LVLARTRARQHAGGDELRNWREGLEKALVSPPKRKRRPLRFIAVGVVLLLIVALLGGYLYWRVIGGLFTRTDVNLQPAAGPALNVLLVGSDSREGLSDPLDTERFGAVGGKRADTLILAQIVPSQQRGVLLHFPRDLYVTVHGGGRQFQSKINAAYNHGPQGIVDTVQALTRLPINHYMEIDIRGFRGMVDAIGGIDVCVDSALYDSKLNFRLPAGTSHLDGNSALSFVRARYATPDGDFGRIKRQQQFIRSVMSKVGRPGVLGNPLRVNELARAFAQNVTVDQFFQLDDLVKFALSVRRVGPEQLETYSIPSRSARLGGQSVVVMEDQQAEVLFQALRNVEDPAQVVPTAQAQSSPSTRLSTTGPVAQAGTPCAPAAPS